VIFCRWLIIACVLHRTISEIQRCKVKKTMVLALVKGIAVKFCCEIYRTKTEALRKQRNPSRSRFITMHNATDRRRRQTTYYDNSRTLHCKYNVRLCTVKFGYSRWFCRRRRRLWRECIMTKRLRRLSRGFCWKLAQGLEVLLWLGGLSLTKKLSIHCRHRRQTTTDNILWQ